VAPLTGVPKTGSEVPFGAGLLLTAAGAGALIAGRRRRPSQR
jgi:LPXTG-motif cell wall-anchored protein